MQVESVETQGDAETQPETSVVETVEPEQVTVSEVVQTPGSKSVKKTKMPGERFQRVKSDQAVFLDDRLRDMSYAAKVRSPD